MACFTDSVSRGSVATYARCGGILIIHLTTNLPRNFSVNFLNRYRLTELWSSVCGPLSAHPICLRTSAKSWIKRTINPRTQEHSEQYISCSLCHAGAPQLGPYLCHGGESAVVGTVRITHQIFAPAFREFRMSDSPSFAILHRCDHHAIGVHNVDSVK